MALALYRKYRPKKLSEVVGQEHITTSLSNALKSGAISHAYLFTGPRGVGKTSIARILAHEINGLPYNEDTQHLDIIEIDAASNRRIDEIRDLRDKVHIAPSSAKYKVYIIDEVHMLTREAFNALLKTLEEPPEHAIFILATTESHKVPDTIVSRTQRYIFKPIPAADAAKHLKDLSKREKIDITDDALDILATHGSGSFRDSINLLDQLSGSGNQIDKTMVESMLGIPNQTIIASLMQALSSKDATSLATTLEQAQQDGLHAAKIAKQLASIVRSEFLDSSEIQYKETATLLRELARVAGSTDSFNELELALFDYVVLPQPITQAVQRPAAQTTPSTISADAHQTKPIPTPQAITQPKHIPANHEPTKPTPSAAIVAEPAEPIPETPLIQSTPESFWNDYLQAIKRKRSTLYSVLRMAKPNLQDDELTLVFSFAFHQKQVSQSANQKMLSETASEMLSSNIQVNAILQKNAPQGPLLAQAVTPSITTSRQPDTPKPSSLLDVSNIFNGAELVE